jgi:hypothetical protein
MMQNSRDMKICGVSEQEGCAGPPLMNRSYPCASENSTPSRLVLAHIPTWLDNQLDDDLVWENAVAYQLTRRAEAIKRHESP